MSIYSTYDFQRQIFNYNSHFSYQTKEFISFVNKKSAIKIPKIFESFFNFKYRLEKDYDKQPFNINNFIIENSNIVLKEELIENKPFCNLIKFDRLTSNYKLCKNLQEQPNLLIIAPLSGHYATLLRDTIQSAVKDHNVYITDWKNARNISINEGEFGLDTYIEYIQDFIKKINDVHILAVCQSTVPALSAISLMAEQNETIPKTLTLMAGPIDARKNPTKVNDLAKEKDITWFKNNLIHKVPERYLGKGRYVYPGFLQLTAFVSMNPKTHFRNYMKYFYDYWQDNKSFVKKHEEFYDEYNAVLDMDAKYYIETVQEVFQKYSLPLGKLKIKENIVKPELINNCKMLTIEGEKDDICGLGQTYAAHDLCTNIKDKRHYVINGVGHYGVFSGKKWKEEIYPIIRDFVRES